MHPVPLPPATVIPNADLVFDEGPIIDPVLNLCLSMNRLDSPFICQQYTGTPKIKASQESTL